MQILIHAYSNNDMHNTGYPFDRRPFITQVQTQDANGNPVVTNIPPSNLESYVAAVPNMGTSQVLLVFIVHNSMVKYI